MARLRSVADIIAPLGGTNTVAGDLGLNPSVVSSWKARGHIPSGNWDKVLRLAQSRRVKEITLELLAELAVRRARRRRRRANGARSRR